MGLFSRIINLIRGWLGLKVSQLEEGNSAIVFDNAIRKKIEDQVELKKAAAGIVQLKKSLNFLYGKPSFLGLSIKNITYR